MRDITSNQRVALVRLAIKGDGTVIHAATARALIGHGYAKQVIKPLRGTLGISLKLTDKGRDFVNA